MAAGLAALCLLAAVAASAAEPTTLTANVEPQLYSVRINGRSEGEAALLKLDGERLLASEADWERWHLLRPATHYLYDGRTYFALDSAPGFAQTLDARLGEARFEFAPQAFASTVVSARDTRRVLPQPPPGLGGFVNYEVVATERVSDAAAKASSLNGVVETGLFDPRGVFTSQWLGRNLTGEAVPADGALGEADIIRLETSVTRDDPDRMETLRLGDGVGASGLWGRPVRYGGARFTRNFSTQPGFVTLPQPALSGETALPAVLDVYVDGLRREHLEVPAGPFVVQNLPTMTGQGDVQVVVRDLLGREQLLTGTYITGVQQLRAGLHDFSYEAGWVREEFGLVSDEYGRFFTAATHRYGFQDDLTGEARLEAGADAQTVGIGGVYAIPRIAAISNAFAISHGDHGYGAMDVLSIQHSARRGLSLGARLQVASEHFTQVGLAAGVPLPARSFSANAGHPVGPLGRVGLSYVNRDNFAPAPDFEAVTLTLTRGFRYATVTLLGIDRISPSPEYSIGLTLTAPIGRRESASVGTRHSEPAAGAGSSQAYARVQRSLPEQEGWGYRVLVQQTETDGTASVTSGEAGVGVNGEHGSYGLEAATFDEVETYRATLGGSVGTMGGHAFASRKLSRSFAVVETGASDVDLLVNNRLAAHTNDEGVAILPYLQPYEGNVVRIDTSNVPLDVEVHSGEFQAVPYYRSGVLIPLDVRRTRSAVLTLLQANGRPVPTGAVATLVATGAEAPVGRHGKTFLTQLAPGDNVVDIRWNHTTCRIVFSVPADAGVQPQLGPYTCPE